MNRFPLSIAIFVSAILNIHGGVIYENSFDSQAKLYNWQGHAYIEDNSLNFSLKDRAKGNFFASITLDPATISGKVIRISCEARGSDISDSNLEKPYNGCKVQIHLKSSSRQTWVNLPFPAGDFGWKKFESVFTAMPEIQTSLLNIGLQNASGRFQVRNLKLEVIGAAANIAAKANRTLADEIAGDGKGGWTDQGPGQDGRLFANELKRNVYQGIPLLPCPETGVLLMKHKICPDGSENVVIPLAADQCKSLYLMHTLAWAQSKEDIIGYVTLFGEHDKRKEFAITAGKDVGDWYYSVAQLPNGFPAVTITLPNKAAAGVYISKFNIPDDFGMIKAIGFRTRQNAAWLIFAASVTSLDVKLPRKQAYVIKAGEQWLPIAGDYLESIKAGSALDRNGFSKVEKVGTYGRIIINKNGHFAFEKKPEQAVRFLACAFTPRNNENFCNHKAIDKFIAELRKTGYNMIRTHFLDSELMKNSDTDLQFNPDVLDRFDYLIHAMKQNGIYLNFDLMTSWIGYSTGSINSKENKNPEKSFKARIHFEPEIREHWRKGVEKILCRVNKYTNTRLIDDPVLVMAVGYNEQEYGFWRPFAEKHVSTAWREFLHRQYGSLDKLKRSWGDKAKNITSFENIPCFQLPSRIYDNDDVALFLREVEDRTLTWYRESMRSMGYPGPVTGYNCGKNQYYNMIRKDAPVVAMNSYHAHPSNWILQNSCISQDSAIGEKAKIFRDFVGVRQADKPIVVTEHNLAYWNKYRYEQAFVVGAYSAFQRFDVLTCHGETVSFHKDNRILTFNNYLDPIARASEFLTYFLFIRGDVSPSNPALRIRVFEDDVFRKNGLRGSTPVELSLPALVAGTAIECVASGKQPDKSDELILRMDKTGAVMVSDAGYSQSLDDKGVGTGKIIEQLKKRKELPASNRSDGHNIFESSTGEIFMDATRKFMQINTPRFQGICAEVGAKALMNDFRVDKITRRGNLSLVSVDGNKTIFNSDRMVLVYTTNALSSNMQFSRPDMTCLIYPGNMPILLEQGSFKVAVHNRNASQLKLYPLDISGNRLKKLVPQQVEDQWADFSVDTAKDGATVFFEICRE